MADRALLPLRNLDKKTMMDMVDKAMVDSAMICQCPETWDREVQHQQR